MNAPKGITEADWQRIRAEVAVMPAMTPEQQTTVALCVKPLASADEAA